jgi:FKBP-type peptidyl-prolyl cis-trans isomerase
VGLRCCVTLALQVIKGWTEAMQLMVEGDKWEM